MRDVEEQSISLAELGPFLDEHLFRTGIDPASERGKALIKMICTDGTEDLMRRAREAGAAAALRSRYADRYDLFAVTHFAPPLLFIRRKQRRKASPRHA